MLLGIEELLVILLAWSVLVLPLVVISLVIVSKAFPCPGAAGGSHIMWTDLSLKVLHHGVP